MDNDMLRVGVITTTHGVRGECKVYPTTDDINRFKKLKEVILLTKRNEQLVLHIEGVKFFKGLVIIKFKEINDMDLMALHKQEDLYITRDKAINLDKDEFFIGDLIGSLVIDENGNEIGKLKDIFQTGANDVYEIETADKKQILVPAIKECILNIDVEKQIITIHIMKGLID